MFLQFPDQFVVVNCDEGIFEDVLELSLMVEINVDGFVEFRRFIDGLACRFNFDVIQLGVVGENMFQDLPRVDVVVLKGGLA